MGHNGIDTISFVKQGIAVEIGAGIKFQHFTGDPPQVSGPAEAGVFRHRQGGGLVTPSKFISEIGTLFPIAPCGRNSL